MQHIQTDFGTCPYEKGDEIFRRYIRQISNHVLQNLGRNVLDAIILIGSPSRGEATVGETSQGLKIYSDLDFYLVPKNGYEGHLLRAVPRVKQLLSLDPTIDVTLNVQTRKDLSNFGPTINTVDLISSGKVIWGDEEILSTVPNYSSHEIVKDDAIKLILNRIIEQLISFEKRKQDRKPNLYSSAKMFIDLSASILAFIGEYHSSYREKERRLKRCFPTFKNLPSIIPDFIQKVEFWTQFKLDPSKAVKETVYSPFPGADRNNLYMAVWLDSIQYARAILLWEIQQLLKPSPYPDTIQLLMSYFTNEPTLLKIKTWLKTIMRRQIKVTQLPFSKLHKIITKGSPRHLMYFSGALLFFCAPVMIQPSAAAQEEAMKYFKLSRDYLPIRHQTNNDRFTAWLQVCEKVTHLMRSLVLLEA